MVKDKPFKLLIWSVVFTLGLVLSLTTVGFKASAQTNNANAYDISEYQGYVNDNQADQLKNEVNFMILKAENGGLYTDPQFNHNAEEMSAHNIPYGVYDYSLYANPAQAQDEAQALYQRAPKASFYVNDSEENNAGNQFNTSTQAWANEIHQLTQKPAVLYSGNEFIRNNFTPDTINSYNAIWDAAYGPEPSDSQGAVNYMPYHYDLWQSTDSHYSPALGQRVDASVFPDGNDKPLSFWTGKGHRKWTAKHVTYRHRHNNRRQRSVIKPRKTRTKKQRVNKRYHQKVRRSNRLKNKFRSVSRRNRRGRKVRRARACKRNCKSRQNRRGHQKRVKITYNPNYYSSNRIHYLKVINPKGIRLYSMKGRYEDGVAPGTVLNVYGFKPVYHRSTGYMTKAIGMHLGQYDLFTSRKDLVQKI